MRPDRAVRVDVSLELLAELGDWSPAVHIMITEEGGVYTMLAKRHECTKDPFALALRHVFGPETFTAEDVLTELLPDELPANTRTYTRRRSALASVSAHLATTPGVVLVTPAQGRQRARYRLML